MFNAANCIGFEAADYLEQLGYTYTVIGVYVGPEVDVEAVHDDSLQHIRREYILTNCKTEFSLKWASFEKEMVYLKNNLIHQGMWDHGNDKPVEKYIWYEMRTGPQRP